MNMIAFWAVATVVFFIIEAIIPGLAAIWFAIGSICALISALLNAPYQLQIVWFVIISLATLILTRPIAKKYFNSKVQATNADRAIGMRCIVTERIDNLAQQGTVLCDGKTWTARSAVDSLAFEEGSTVIVQKIIGVRLIVTLDETKNESMEEE